LVNDLLLDSEGKKMSKSKGNIVEPFTTMKEYGADTVRFYLPYVSPVWTPLKFDMTGLKEVYSKFFNPLRNTYNFFSMYANTDLIDINNCNVKYENRLESDKWLISRYNNLLKYVTASYEEYDLNKVVHALTDFVSDDLSNWYIRRNRNRFWGSTLDNSKKSVYLTTYEVLVGICKMMAPIVPYLSEEMYIDLTGEKSVHLADFPKYNEKLIDSKLEKQMDLVRNLISIGRNVRESANIKVRQPLSEVLLDGRLKKTIANLDTLILEELNIKKLTYITDLTKYMNFTVKPNFKEAGPMFGSKIGEYTKALSNLTDEEIMCLEQDLPITIEVDHKTYEIKRNLVDIRINAKEGFNVCMENNNFVILNTTLTQDLKDEGLAREFISKIQQLRKNANFEVDDRIEITLQTDLETEKSLMKFKDYIMHETLTEKFSVGNASENILINDVSVNVSIKKVD
jgi:isoleucyl-tRNA synthetase